MLRDRISEAIVTGFAGKSLRQKNEVGELIIGFDRFIIMSLVYSNILYNTIFIFS